MRGVRPVGVKLLDVEEEESDRQEGEDWADEELLVFLFVIRDGSLRIIFHRRPSRRLKESSQSRCAEACLPTTGGSLHCWGQEGRKV